MVYGSSGKTGIVGNVESISWRLGWRPEPPNPSLSAILESITYLESAILACNNGLYAKAPTPSRLCQQLHLCGTTAYNGGYGDGYETPRLKPRPGDGT